MEKKNQTILLHFEKKDGNKVRLHYSKRSQSLANKDYKKYKDYIKYKDYTLIYKFGWLNHPTYQLKVPYFFRFIDSFILTEKSFIFI